jgi:hypothetical protein
VLLGVEESTQAAVRCEGWGEALATPVPGRVSRDAFIKTASLVDCDPKEESAAPRVLSSLPVSTAPPVVMEDLREVPGPLLACPSQLSTVSLREKGTPIPIPMRMPVLLVTPTSIPPGV